MKGKSKVSKMKQGKDSTMSSPTNVMQLELPLFAIVESQVQNKKTTLLDKLVSCVNSTPMEKSSKTSEADSTSKEKDCNPYWSDLCEEISSRLLLPVEIGCADSDLNYSSLWHSKTVDKSWFLTNLFTACEPNSQPIFLPSFTSSLVECTDLEVTARKSRKIRLSLSPEQKAILKHWFGVSRYVYNKTIEYLQQPDTKANWMAIKTGILNELPEWASSVPYQIKSIAIKDACLAVKSAKKGFKQDGKIRKCKFRTRKDRQQTIYVPKSAIKDCGIYHTKLGKTKFKEALPQNFSDGRLTLAYGEYYLIVSEEVLPQQTDNQGRVVALDPGVRTFMTFLSENSFGWLGNESNLYIQKLCFKLDKLISKISKAKSKQKKRLKKASDRLRAKIKHLVQELHHKIAKFLTDNFDVILLPTFETS